MRSNLFESLKSLSLLYNLNGMESIYVRLGLASAPATCGSLTVGLLGNGPCRARALMCLIVFEMTEEPRDTRLYYVGPCIQRGGSSNLCFWWCERVPEWKRLAGREKGSEWSVSFFPVSKDKENYIIVSPTFLWIKNDALSLVLAFSFYSVLAGVRLPRYNKPLMEYGEIFITDFITSVSLASSDKRLVKNRVNL